jgi:hypothetical protein
VLRAQGDLPVNFVGPHYHDAVGDLMAISTDFAMKIWQCCPDHTFTNALHERILRKKQSTAKRKTGYFFHSIRTM